MTQTKGSMLTQELMDMLSTAKAALEDERNARKDAEDALANIVNLMLQQEVERDADRARLEELLRLERESKAQIEARLIDLANKPAIVIPEPKEPDLSPLMNQNNEIIALLKQCIEMPEPPFPEIVAQRGSDGRLLKFILK